MYVPVSDEEAPPEYVFFGVFSSKVPFTTVELKDERVFVVSFAIFKFVLLKVAEVKEAPVGTIIVPSPSLLTARPFLLQTCSLFSTYCKL